MDQAGQKDQVSKTIIDFEMLDHVINEIIGDLSSELHNKNQNLNDSLISVSKADQSTQDFDIKISRLTSLLEVLSDLFSLQSQSDR
jgi:hypothetical protein